MQLTPESHNRINIYYASFTKVLSELVRFSGNNQETLCALGEICHRETPDKESFSCIGKFYKIASKILEAKQKMYASWAFVVSAGFTTWLFKIISELLKTIHENYLNDMFPELLPVIFQCGAYPCSDTCYNMFSSTIIQCSAFSHKTMNALQFSLLRNLIIHVFP